MFSDCIASIKLASPMDLTLTAQEGGSSGGGSGSGGSSNTEDSTRTILVDKASLRFFKFQRGELVVLK